MSRTAIPIADIWMNFVEKPLDNLGLFRNPLKRFAVVTAGTALTLRALKPPSLFDTKSGEPHPSIFFSDSQDAVPMDYLTLSALIGSLSVLLV